MGTRRFRETGTRRFRVLTLTRHLKDTYVQKQRMDTRNLIFLLDRSGSMESCWDDTIGGFNSFVSDQALLGGKLTLIQFDHEILQVYSNTDLKDVVPLTRKTFTPRGSTALLDAIGSTIKEWGGPPPTLIILTDGHENASTKFTKAHVKDLIEQKQKEGWTVMYLGANQDAFAEAGAMGIGAAHTMNYDVRDTPEAFRSLSAACSQVASN
jgi:Mg-chelatase subunit ChlD